MHDIVVEIKSTCKKLHVDLRRSRIFVAMIFSIFILNHGMNSSYSTAFAQQGSSTTQSEQPSTPQNEGNAVSRETASDKEDDALQDRGQTFGSEAAITSHRWVNAGFTGFVDAQERAKLPEQALLDKGLRLVTSDDFPPFNYRGADDAPEGFHIEMARALCEELGIACTLKLVPFREIPTWIAGGKADASLAGIANHIQLQDKLAFSHVYLKRPARFVRKFGTILKLDKKGLKQAAVAVRGGTAHEAFLRTYFAQVNRVPVTDLAVAEQLLMDGKVQAIFGDAFQMIPMVAEDEGLVEFVGKPYYDAHFFGDGMAIAYGRDQTGIRTLLNYGLLRLAQSGRMAELYASHFPVDVYAARD